jgi:hypothetical protein
LLEWCQASISELLWRVKLHVASVTRLGSFDRHGLDGDGYRAGPGSASGTQRHRSTGKPPPQV